MKRMKKIALVSHCILNGNSKVEGLCGYKGSLIEVVEFLLNKGYGIIQLPCPEMIMYGIKRWGHVKEQFDTPFFRQKCREIFKDITNQLIDYENNGYEISLLIGIDGSPSCGINKTCTSKQWGGEFLENINIRDKINTLQTSENKGVFIEEIIEILNDHKIYPKSIAIDENDITRIRELSDTELSIIEYLKENNQ